MNTQPEFVDGAWQDSPTLVDVIINGMARKYPVDGLKRRVGWHDDEDETCNWIEYRLEGVVVHRSVAMHVKKAIFAGGAEATNFV